MSDEVISLYIYHRDEEEDLLTIMWNEGITAEGLKKLVLQTFFKEKKYNIFTQMEIIQNNKIMEDFDEISAGKAECKIKNDNKIPDSITLQEILDKMKDTFDLSDNCELMITPTTKAANANIRKLFTTSFNDLIVIDKGKNQMYYCNIQLSDILKIKSEMTVKIIPKRKE